MTTPTLTVGLANYGSTFAARRVAPVRRPRPRRRRRGRRSHRRRRPRRDGPAHRELRVGQVPGAARRAVVRAAHDARRDRGGHRRGCGSRPASSSRRCGPPALLAKQAATLDVLSRRPARPRRRHRLAARGVRRGRASTFEQRGQLLTDTLAACKALWRDTPAALDTPDAVVPRHLLRAQAAAARRRAVVDRGHAARAATSTASCGRATRWIPIMGATVDDIADGAAPASEARGPTAGRDPAALQVQAPLRIEHGRRRPARPRAQHGVRARTRSPPARPTCT